MTRLWLLVLCLCFTGVVSAASLCAPGRTDLAPHVGLLEDRGAVLNAEQVLALGSESFSVMAEQPLVREYSRNAYWMRIELRNDSTHECERWLTVGDPRLQDIRVYVQHPERLDVMRAGSDYPLEQWPVADRQPRFPLMLAPGEQATVLMRVAGASLFILSPSLWTDDALLEQRQSVYMADGITLGIVLLIVPFSLIVGWILGSRLLQVHATSVFSYVVLTAVINGYLVFLPSLLHWAQEITALVSMVSFICVLGYARVLLEVRQLPRVWGMAFNFLLVAYLGGYAWDWLVARPDGRIVVEWVMRIGVYALLPATLLAAWYHGLRLRWMAWAVPLLFLLQFVVRYVLQLNDLVPWQSREAFLSLSSTLPGVVLLVCTLITEVTLSRRREKGALSDLETQRQAEHERLESTVERRTRQLRESLRARSSLMARISHDLRSPLIGIIDYSRLLQGGDLRDYPRKIERHARQQLEMIDELLEFSRSELQQMELSLAPGYLYGFLHEIEEEGAFLAARQGNRFACHLATDLPLLVRADFQRLRQILINLLSNAAKFTHDGDVRFAVECLDREAGTARLRFSVTDTGIGIHPDEREQLLLPFRRGRNAADFQGTGLGLSIVTQLLHPMGGELQLDAPAGTGSRFVFELSFELAEEDELESSLAESHGGDIDGAGRRVLFVDDVAHNRDMLFDLLAGYGFDVDVVGNAEAALYQLAEAPYALLICDQMMPGMDGWALLRTVRRRSPELPVMLYSAAPARPPTGEVLQFDAVLLKPATSAELLACIERLCPLETVDGQTV
ncbi:MAG: ATP-binding protein [Pseudomonas sp.]|uniref:hybrid sensor histidine kinase/response regulator n=1 Tax=Pseudomonas sp. TaxID=306 RepID=UPI003D132B28